MNTFINMSLVPFGSTHFMETKSIIIIIIIIISKNNFKNKILKEETERKYGYVSNMKKLLTT